MQKVVEKDGARVALEFGLNQRVSYVDLTSGGDEAKILSSNFPVKDPPTPIGALPASVDFLATLGDMEGEIDLIWSRVRGAQSYIVQYSPYAMPRVWEQEAVVTKSKATVADCTPGKMYVFRVAAVGAAGQGPWSDESVKRAP
ncbi:MAG: fibronectin type III domain-containing protein [Verrucomicrobiota bacterium]